MVRSKLSIIVSAAVGFIVLFLLLAGLVVSLFGNPLDPFDNRNFSAAGWTAANEEGRAAMARDLVSRRLVKGDAESKVVALLGAPGWIEYAGKGSRVFGARTYVYPIGNWSFQGMDDAFVYVHLDAGDRVITAEIFGY